MCAPTRPSPGHGVTGPVIGGSGKKEVDGKNGLMVEP